MNDRSDLAGAFRQAIKTGDKVVPSYLAEFPPEVVWAALGDALGGHAHRAVELLLEMLSAGHLLTQGVR